MSGSQLEKTKRFILFLNLLRGHTRKDTISGNSEQVVWRRFRRSDSDRFLQSAKSFRLTIHFDGTLRNGMLFHHVATYARISRASKK